MEWLAGPGMADVLLTGLIFLAALLYASVGHAGASGYLAAMALMGVAPAVMRPAALSLNILVAMIAGFRFVRAGAFSWRLFWPMAITSVPCALAGGLLVLPGQWYKPLVGVVLLYAAGYAFRSSRKAAAQEIRPVSTPVLLVLGAALGFLSGLSGVGGGIFLSPLLLYFRWAETRTISGIAALFILVNSIAGLIGVISKTGSLPAVLPYWAVAAVAGGWIGAEFGSRRLGNSAIRRALAAVLVIAGLKMVLV